MTCTTTALQCCLITSLQASIAGTAIATLQKELSATSSTQKITKSVKAPTVKPGETRVRAEPTPSPQFPFADMPAPDTYKSQAGIEVKKEVGVSISGSTVREEHFEVLRGREAKVGLRRAGGRSSPFPCPCFVLSSMLWKGGGFCSNTFITWCRLMAHELSLHSVAVL